MENPTNNYTSTGVYSPTLIITTDHGTINVKNPSKVIGDKNTSLNLRYKTGKSLTYEGKDVLAAVKPERIKLPSIHMSSSFIFAKGDLFFAYQALDASKSARDRSLETWQAIKAMKGLPGGWTKKGPVRTTTWSSAMAQSDV